MIDLDMVWYIQMMLKMQYIEAMSSNVDVEGLG